MQRRPDAVRAPSASALGLAYWAAVRAASLGLVRVVTTGDGVELRLLGGPVLLALGEATTSDGEVLVYRRSIAGGRLAGEAGGALTLTQTPAELSVSVTDFVPRWGTLLYGLVQRPFHVWVSRRFFAQLERGR